MMLSETNRKPDELDEDIDRCLGESPGAFQPSAAFTHRVMVAVHAEADAAASYGLIAFPWRRALPGLVAAAFVAGLCLAMVLASMAEHLPTWHAQSLLAEWASASLADMTRLRLGWLATSVLVALMPLPFSTSVTEMKRQTYQQ